MRCKNCKEKFEPTRFLQKYCLIKDECIQAFLAETREQKKKGFNKKSKKRIKEENLYRVLKKQFLSLEKNSICPITKGKPTDIHHMKGRIGKLLNDTNYWIALSREGHQKVESNPVWAKKNGYSLNRLDNNEDRD